MTRPLEEVAEVLELGSRGLTASAISRDTGIPRGTVRDWLGGSMPRRSLYAPPDEGTCPVCGSSAHCFEQLPRAYCYLLGLYLGDGWLSTHRRGVYKLRVALDSRYPGIIGECGLSITTAFPQIKVAYVDRGTWTEVYAYSKAMPCLFPQHGPGKKHERAILLRGWQETLVRRWPEALLRGLIHSDGCRFMNSGTNWRHPRYAFNNHSDDIRAIFCRACDELDVRWTTAPRTVYVSRKADVAKLDEFIGPKT